MSTPANLHDPASAPETPSPDARSVSERHFHDLMTDVRLIGLMLDLTGTVTFCNDYFLELTGWARDEVVGANWFTRALPEDVHARVAEIFRAAVERGEIPSAYENEILTRTGARLLVAWNNTILRDGQGAVAGIASLGADVTEGARAVQALRESEAKHRRLFDAVGDAIFIIDFEARILASNACATERLGYTHDELLAMTVHALDAPEEADRVRQRLEMLALAHRLTFETTLVGKDGTPVPVEVTAKLTEWDGQRAIIAVCRDLSERRRAEAAHDSLQTQLLQAQKMESIGRLAGGVAHDFNNMLSVILGHAEIALELAAPGSPLEASLHEIQQAGRRSADLTRQLLAFARKQTVAPSVLDVNAVVGASLTLLRRLIGENIRLTWRPAPDAPPIRMDPAQLDQVLVNLCVNASDAIGGVGTITIESAAVELDEAFCAARGGGAPGTYLRLVVGGTGCGMDAETRAHLFEPFFTTKGQGKGTGLGLAMVYGVVAQNLGFIDVESEPGQGTAFSLYLPRDTSRPDPRHLQAGGPSPGRGHETVLLVEDEPAILRMTEAVLTRHGYRVLAAATPGDALRLAEAYDGALDLLLTDVVMPEMNGAELSRRLLVLHPGMRRIFVSGYTADVFSEHGIEAEGVPFLQKPCPVQELVAKVRHVLDQRA